MSGRGFEKEGLRRRRLSRSQFAGELAAHAERLWTVAAGVLGDPAEAEDVVQEAALAALGKLDEFDADTSFPAWMGTFVRNVALNAARKTRRRATRNVPNEAIDLLPDDAREAARNGSATADRLPGTRPAVDGEGNLLVDQTAFDDRVFAALRTLAPTARAALLLRTVLDLSYAEISLVLGVPEGTAMSHVHRARTRMRLELLDPSQNGSVASQRDELAVHPEAGDPT